jgi:uncharacterized protein (DUF4415 family)
MSENATMTEQWKYDENGVWIDEDDAPELTHEMFLTAKVYKDGVEVPNLYAKKFGRPPLETPKKALNIRLSQEVLAAFKASGKGWQTRIDAVLKDYLKANNGKVV